MGILDTYSDGAKQADIDEILGFLASLEKVKLITNPGISGWSKILLCNYSSWKLRKKHFFLEGTSLWKGHEKKSHE